MTDYQFNDAAAEEKYDNKPVRVRLSMTNARIIKAPEAAGTDGLAAIRTRELGWVLMLSNRQRLPGEALTDAPMF